MAHFILIELAVLFILTISSAKVNAATTQQVDLNPYATVFLYSGRPNPRWHLTSKEWQQLRQLIQILPKLTDDNIGPYQFKGNFGYSGFHAHYSIISSYPDIYYVANKHQVILSNPGRHIIFIDEQKLIQKWFANSAKIHDISLPLSINHLTS